MKQATENWLKIAKYDLKVANDNFKLANFITVVEKCHCSLEKLLKGIITENNQEPQKIHDLLRLASEAMITDLQDDTLRVMRELDQAFMSTRYPDEYEYLYKDLDEHKTKNILDKTKGIFTWLEKKIK